MPFKGSADVGGKHREASADSTLLQQGAFLAASFSDEMRVTGLSRITFNVRQGGGVAGTFDIFYRIREDSTPILYRTVIIGAVGVPEVVTIHLAARKVFVRLNTATGYIISIYSTGQS